LTAGSTTGIGIGFLLLAEIFLIGALAGPGAVFLVATGRVAGRRALLASGGATVSFSGLFCMILLLLLDSNNQ